MYEDKVGYKSVIDFGREAQIPFPHSAYDYPTKILPQVMGEFIERFSKGREVVLDPFSGSDTVAVECAIRNRRSINIDINPKAIEIAKNKLELIQNGNLFASPPSIEQQQLLCGDARNLPIEDASIDAIVTDIPYADMIKYSDLPNDLSTIEDYNQFLLEIDKAFAEMYRVLKKSKYCVIFVADYRIARSRLILPLHADVIYLMTDKGFVLFDIYIWRYYRSGGFRPFGSKPYQAMNTHSYILVFYKPEQDVEIIKNRPIRYRDRLKEKLQNNKQSYT
jgi:DNA modification methylase